MAKRLKTAKRATTAPAKQPGPLFLNVSDFEDVAKAKMSAPAYNYYAGAAGDELTLAENVAAFGRIWLRPRALVGVESIDTTTSLLGHPLSFPVALAPTAFNKLGHPDGELAAARAAAKAGTLMCCSTIATCPLEEISACTTGALFFQLYVYRDRDVTRDLVRRAEAAKFKALVLTVDTPRLGRRERDVRQQFTLPAGISIANLQRYGNSDALRWAKASSFSEYVHSLLDSSLTWESVTWLRSITKLPILIKGILSPDDAALAVEHGAAGVIVSNHGGRQLDGAMATVDALPAVVDRVAGRVPVLMDGGIRRGVDVLKAVALGATAVLIGRPYLWALAADGEAGVTRLLTLLKDEFELAMALAGARDVKGVTRELLAPHRL